ncbi:MAG: AMP-binding protein [Planctomycetes bacterium]|nr:AMP-binding protein [Planctomycetota bacterium]
MSDDQVARERAPATVDGRQSLQIAGVRPGKLILIVMANHLSEEERLDPDGLKRLQCIKLGVLCEQAVRSSAFYRDRLAGLSFDPADDLLSMLPFTTREDLEKDQEAFPPYGSLLTQPREAYQRLHQTSGSRGRPLVWLDTAETWAWWKRCWAMIYKAAGITARDRLMFPFSFGPFIGFWGAFESAQDLGNFVMPTGGMSTTARLRTVIDHEITVLCCTPTYALRMAEVATEEGIDIAASAVTALIVAGEPGGAIPSTRSRIESAWGARVFDHAGMTEMGPWGFECREAPGGQHVMENEFIAEVVEPGSGTALPDGQVGELVLTNLGRSAMPLIRYRTGDRVVLQRGRCACGRSFARIEGGVLGRVDDMLIIRGNNVFPHTIEDLLREFPEVAEFRITVRQPGALAELRIEVEPLPDAATGNLTERIRSVFVDRLHFKPTVNLVNPGCLPRFEMKAGRFVQDGGDS